MTISDLIGKLQQLRAQHGDLQVHMMGAVEPLLHVGRLENIGRRGVLEEPETVLYIVSSQGDFPAS